MQDLIEYKVRTVTRYVVTRFERRGDSGGCAGCGEFDNFDTAYAVGYALCKAEHDRLGWPLDDKRIRYPANTIVGNEETPSVANQIGTANNDADVIQRSLDALALALPDGFVWPAGLRRDYEKACRAVRRISLGTQ